MLFKHENPDAMLMFEGQIIRFYEGEFETDDKAKIDFLKRLPQVTAVTKRQTAAETPEQ